MSTRSTLGLVIGAALLTAPGCRDSSGADPTPPDDETTEDTYRLASYLPVLPTEFESHRPACDDVLTLGELPIRLFQDDGHLFHFEVTPESARAGDTQACDGDSPPAGAPCPNYATNVRVVPWGANYCADSGKVELDLVGGKNFRPWLGIPTFRFDSSEFSDQSFADGTSKLRFHNGQGGATILREAIALRIWRALGQPAPRSVFVRTQANVWDTAIAPGAQATHLMLEPYKKQFFDQSLPQTDSVWEGEGDPFGEGWQEVECEWSAEEDCNDDARDMVIAQVRAEEEGPGYRQRTAAFVDWPSIDAFRCLSALTDAGDDWIHTGDNVVLVLSEMGMLSYLPRRLDRSAGLSKEPTTFDGSAHLIQKCDSDPDCRAAAISTCEDLLSEFEQLDLVTTIVDERCAKLTELGLDREGDAAACDEIRAYYETAPTRLREEVR